MTKTPIADLRRRLETMRSQPPLTAAREAGPLLSDLLELAEQQDARIAALEAAATKKAPRRRG